MILDSDDRGECVEICKICEQAERYDEMADVMAKAVDLAIKEAKELSIEERNLLSVAFKNAAGTRRAAWRVLSGIEAKERKKGNARTAELAALKKKQVEDELLAICKRVLSLQAKLLHLCTSPESKVFFKKLAGDYERYVAEFSDGEAKGLACERASKAYKEAMEVAKVDLDPTHPIRLGLALNYSVFHYEILNMPQAACDMAKAAFDGALTGFDYLDEGSYKDTTLIMQLLRDNLTLWTSDMQCDSNEGLKTVDVTHE